MDSIDSKILTLLQENARIRQNKIAAEVGLTIPAISERIRKLKAKGIVRGFHADVDYKKIGRDVLAFVFVTVESSKYYKEFVDNCLKEDEIFECHSITGDGSHLLKVITENTSSLEQLLSRIQSWPGVKGTRTNVVLSSFKERSTFKILGDEK